MHQTKSERRTTLTESSTYLNEAIAIWLRDLRIEFRTRYALNAILMFALTTLTVASFSFGALSLSPRIISSSIPRRDSASVAGAWVLRKLKCSF